MGILQRFAHFITRVLLISLNLFFYWSDSCVYDSSTWHRCISIGLVTGLQFFSLRAKGNSGEAISQMRIPSENVVVNKTDLELATRLPATTLITTEALWCIMKAFKVGTHPLDPTAAATNPPPLLHSRVCEWVGGVGNRGTGYRARRLISPTYRKNFKTVCGFQIYPLKKV